ncbi:MAG: pirin family protein [Bacteroidia bacterium]
MRKIKQTHQAVYAPIDDLITYRALPLPALEFLDPFLFLNHHGPQHYKPGNNGLPFGPHPHRGFETLTLILNGEITHKDSSGGESTIYAGGIQWMTAGSGLIHSEVSSEEFKENGGLEEVIQIWLNLPSKLKMTEPEYTGLQKEEIPKVVLDNGRVSVDVISGQWGQTQGAIDPPTHISMFTIKGKEGAKWEVEVPTAHNILFYVVNGKVKVNGLEAETHHLVEFAHEGEKLQIEALTEVTLVFGHGAPFNEPIVAHGPFVMNTQEEIRQAIRDYQSGKMGEWN